MGTNDYIDKQKKLVEKILELSKFFFENPQEDVKRELIFFRQIYSNDFRHSYSQFFPVVVKIANPSYDGGLEILLENLKFLECEAYDEKDDGFNETRKHIRKLCDHLTLEIYRFQSDTNDVRLAKNTALLQKIDNEMREKSGQLAEIEQKTDDTSKKLGRIQTETVGIISIFAAITLTVSGGLSYLSSAIGAVGTSPITKLILAVLACGFILFNTVFILIYIVSRLLDKSIFLSCSNEKCLDCSVNKNAAKEGNATDESKKEKTKKKQKIQRWGWFKKVKNCLPYVFGMDFILLVMMIATVAFMFFQKTPCCPTWLK